MGRRSNWPTDRPLGPRAAAAGRLGWPAGQSFWSCWHLLARKGLQLTQGCTPCDHKVGVHPNIDVIVNVVVDVVVVVDVDVDMVVVPDVHVVVEVVVNVDMIVVPDVDIVLEMVVDVFVGVVAEAEVDMVVVPHVDVVVEVAVDVLVDMIVQVVVDMVVDRNMIVVPDVGVVVDVDMVVEVTNLGARLFGACTIVFGQFLFVFARSALCLQPTRSCLSMPYLDSALTLVHTRTHTHSHAQEWGGAMNSTTFVRKRQTSDPIAGGSGSRSDVQSGEAVVLQNRTFTNFSRPHSTEASAGTDTSACGSFGLLPCHSAVRAVNHRVNNPANTCFFLSIFLSTFSTPPLRCPLLPTSTRHRKAQQRNSRQFYYLPSFRSTEPSLLSRISCTFCCLVGLSLSLSHTHTHTHTHTHIHKHTLSLSPVWDATISGLFGRSAGLLAVTGRLVDAAMVYTLASRASWQPIRTLSL
ncbi:unnamed protein product [Protopolystoma xenopodis]|uniref:Uncharacterized protein n=1 Tax=Protopolystoma xenopodis TaxID=117903 RepID=A0A448XIC0_9PLAT|nr:unnamed protein product [Protopolystoma xenopodis]